MPSFLIERFKRVRQRVDTSSQLRVSMLGPSGVGKTSLLATIYDQFERVVTQADLQLTPEPRGADELDRKIVALNRLFASDGFHVDPRQGIQGDVEPRTFYFLLGRKGKRATLQVEFLDYPGGYIAERATEAELQYVLQLIRQSDAILIPVDAPALMERNGLWHRERNRPDFICDLFKQAYQDLQAPRLVVFTPIRSELYLHDPEVRAQMVDRVREGYSRLFGFLNAEHFQRLVTVVVAPVQTLGEIEFHASPKDRYLPVFKKTHPNAKYNPKDSEQPLRYLLRFIMRLHRDKRQKGYFGFVRSLFKGDAYLIEACTVFANGSKEGDGYAIIQGHEWISQDGA